MLVIAFLLLCLGCDRKDKQPHTYYQIDTNSVTSTNITILEQRPDFQIMDAKYSIAKFRGTEVSGISGRVITSDGLYKLVRDAGVGSSAVALMADGKYALPTAQWVNSDLWGGVREFMFKNGTLGYKIGVNDCDDQARQIATFAQMLNTGDSLVSKTPVSVGEFWYKRENPAGMHALVLCVVRDGETVGLKFMEIDGSPATLSENEIRSCIMFRF